MDEVKVHISFRQERFFHQIKGQLVNLRIRQVRVLMHNRTCPIISIYSVYYFFLLPPTDRLQTQTLTGRYCRNSLSDVDSKLWAYRCLVVDHIFFRASSTISIRAWKPWNITSLLIDVVNAYFWSSSRPSYQWEFRRGRLMYFSIPLEVWLDSSILSCIKIIMLRVIMINSQGVVRVILSDLCGNTRYSHDEIIFMCYPLSRWKRFNTFLIRKSWISTWEIIRNSNELTTRYFNLYYYVQLWKNRPHWFLSNFRIITFPQRKATKWDFSTDIPTTSTRDQIRGWSYDLKSIHWIAHTIFTTNLKWQDPPTRPTAEQPSLFFDNAAELKRRLQIAHNQTCTTL